MVVTRRGMTLEEFLKLPERKPALEYADGVVTQKVAPKGRHSRLQGELYRWFNAWAEPRRLASAFPELRTTYAGRSYVPDVAVYRWERIALDANRVVPDEFFEPPDIAVEIVSPEQSVRSQVRKCQWYVEHGVPLALVANPDDRAVRLLRPGAEPLVLRDDAVIDFGPVLPGLQLSVRDLFAMLQLGGPP
jgi:Uma2 family endonuclease